MMFRQIACALLGLCAGIASAQESTVPNGQTFGVWTVNCTAVAVGQTSCVLSQQIHRGTDNAFIAQVLAFQNLDATKTYLSARVPLGAYLPAGFAIKAEDQEDVLPFVWQTCAADLCEALAEIDPAKLAELAGVERNILGAFRPNLQSEDFVFRFSMAGVIEGLAALDAAKTK